MRNRLDSRIPDTACQEWLGIVGSMMAALVICGLIRRRPLDVKVRELG
jgi:hypothetical protein